MSKIDALQNLSNLQNETSAVQAINNNNAVVRAALENTLSRDGSTPNQMNSSLDMNSNKVINLPDAVSEQEPATFGQLNDAIDALNQGGVISASFVTASSNGTLNNERVLTAGKNIAIIDSPGTLETSGTITLNVSDTLVSTVIDLSSNTLTGTKAQFNTAMTDDNFATLTGTETLTNKTLTGGTINSTTVGATTPSTGAFTTVSATGTVTSASGFTAVSPFGAHAALQTAGGIGFRWGLVNNGTYMLQRTTDGFSSGVIPILVNASNVVTFPLTTASTSTTTGALTVAGGVGIAGSLYVGSSTVSIDANGLGIGAAAPAGVQIQISNATGSQFRLVTTGTGAVDYRMATIDGAGGAAIFGTYSNHPFVFYANAAEAIRLTPTKQFIINGAPSSVFSTSDQLDVVAGSVRFRDTTASTSSTTGALKVGGGVGIAGALNVGGSIVGNAGAFVLGTITSNTGATGATGFSAVTTGSHNPAFNMYDTTDGGWVFFSQGGNYNIGKANTSGAWTANYFQISPSGTVNVQATTASTSSTTGALIVGGGVGIAGALNVAGPSKLFTPSFTFGTGSAQSIGADSANTGNINQLISGNSGTVSNGSTAAALTANLGSGTAAYVALSATGGGSPSAALTTGAGLTGGLTINSSLMSLQNLGGKVNIGHTTSGGPTRLDVRDYTTTNNTAVYSDSRRSVSSVTNDFITTVEGVTVNQTDAGTGRFVMRNLGTANGYVASTKGALTRALEAHTLCDSSIPNDANRASWIMELGLHSELAGDNTSKNSGIFLASSHSGWLPTGVRNDTGILIGGEDGWVNAIKYIDTNGSTTLFNVDQTGTVTSAAVITGNFVANGIVELTGTVTPATIATNQNDYNPGSYTFGVRLSSSAAVTITGIVGAGTHGVIQTFTNVGTFPITLASENASSVAANRLHLTTDTVIPAGGAVQLRYDVTLLRWVHVSGGVLPALQNTTSSLGADVALNNIANYFDGPSFNLGTTGTWFVSGTVSVVDTAGAASVFCKLWDGTTVIASGWVTTSGANFAETVSLSGITTNPAGNLRISVRDSTSTSGKILFNTTGNAKDSTISGMRIL